MKTIPTTEFAAESTVEDFRDVGAAGFVRSVFKELVVVASAAADTTMDMLIPANFVIEGYTIKAATAITYATAVATSLGDGSDADRIARVPIASLEDLNESSSDVLAAPDYNTTAFNPHLYATDGTGTEDGTVAGSFAVVIWGYEVPQIESF